MASQFTDRVIRRSGTSYLVLGPDPEAPDWFWVRAIDRSRTMSRMRRDDIEESLAPSTSPPDSLRTAP
jgi:hypothetical protein